MSPPSRHLDRVLFVRVPAPLLARLDARLAAERSLHPNRAVSRADVVRDLLEQGLAAHEPRRPRRTR